MRKIPKKNYVYLTIIVVFTVVVTLVLSRIYNNHHQKESVLYGFLSEVTLEDLDTYLLENEIAVLYIDDKYNVDDNEEEKQLKEKIVEYHLNDRFVFLDSLKIDQEFIEQFEKKYNYSFKEDYPMLLIIKNKKVIKTYHKINVKEIEFEELK